MVSSSSPPKSPFSVSHLTTMTIFPSGDVAGAGAGDLLKLSISDLPMLSCHYIQKGLLFPKPPFPAGDLLPLLASSLSRALAVFPPLAGRLVTLPGGAIVISVNGAGAELVHAAAPSLSLPDLLPFSSDVPHEFKSFFPLDGAVSYDAHRRPISAFQLTELGDGTVFIACSVSHAVVDGTSFWNFFNSWAELCRSGSGTAVSRSPDFRRSFFGGSPAVLNFPPGEGPAVTFDANAPIRERILHFSRAAIAELKRRANEAPAVKKSAISPIDEVYGKLNNDPRRKLVTGAGGDEISSFQGLCGQIWVSLTRARTSVGLSPAAETTFRMAVNCRHRLSPPIDPLYFGNAIQSIPTTAAAGDVAALGLRWAAGKLHGSVVSYGDARVRAVAAEWEAKPRVFPLGNSGGGGVTMGSSPRFPMYDNDFGWGKPVAVRSGRANKFDGKISAFPAREGGGGGVDLEVCLSPETMAALLKDQELMQFVSDDSPITV